MEDHSVKTEFTVYSSFVYFLYLTDLLMTMLMSGSGFSSAQRLHLFPCTAEGFVLRCLAALILLIVIGLAYRGCSAVQSMILRSLILICGLLCFLRLCVSVFIASYDVMIFL
jgi:hypothetical protein